MAFTKIFLGNLPELTNEIIQYFRDDFSTLHSCILVNRLWCQLSIPLLWENPFSLKYPKNYHYIEVYLYKLNDDDKMQLNNYRINNELLPSNTLFNYSNFIQQFDTHKIIASIKRWANKHSENFNLMKFIYKSLIKLFNESEANIHTLYVVYNETYHNIIVSELVSSSPNFICNIRNLYFKIDSEVINIHNYQKLEKNLCNIIDSQQNLKKISLDFNSFPLYHSLLSSKYPNCTNTLRTIIFYYIDFDDIVVSNELFKQLNVLESIHILYCYSLDSNFFQQINPFKLKSLFMNELLTIPQLLQKSGNYLENFGLMLEDRSLLKQEQELLELIIKYCSTNIKFLRIYRFEDQNIYKLFHLIEKVELSLNYLTIKTNYDNDSLGSIVLQNLGQILPSRLEYLNLILVIKPNDFKIFLKNLQNTFIKKLLINNYHIKKEEQKDLLPYIKEYIMKKKRTKYLALLECFLPNFCTKIDLYSLKDEVKEFRLHNIIVQNYDDLEIESYKFVNEMY